MSNANDRQVAGLHYRTEIQHWDYVVANDLNYFEGQATKYITRCRRKNGKQDIEKAIHFLEKYLEVYDQMVDISERVSIDERGTVHHR